MARPMESSKLGIVYFDVGGSVPLWPAIMDATSAKTAVISGFEDIQNYLAWCQPAPDAIFIRDFDAFSDAPAARVLGVQALRLLKHAESPVRHIPVIVCSSRDPALFMQEGAAATITPQEMTSEPDSFSGDVIIRLLSQALDSDIIADCSRHEQVVEEVSDDPSSDDENDEGNEGGVLDNLELEGLQLENFQVNLVMNSQEMLNPEAMERFMASDAYWSLAVSDFAIAKTIQECDPRAFGRKVALTLKFVADGADEIPVHAALVDAVCDKGESVCGEGDEVNAVNAVVLAMAEHIMLNAWEQPSGIEEEYENDQFSSCEFENRLAPGQVRYFRNLIVAEIGFMEHTDSLGEAAYANSQKLLARFDSDEDDADEDKIEDEEALARSVVPILERLARDIDVEDSFDPREVFKKIEEMGVRDADQAGVIWTVMEKSLEIAKGLETEYECSALYTERDMERARRALINASRDLRMGPQTRELSLAMAEKLLWVSDSDGINLVTEMLGAFDLYGGPEGWPLKTVTNIIYRAVEPPEQKGYMPPAPGGPSAQPG